MLVGGGSSSESVCTNVPGGARIGSGDGPGTSGKLAYSGLATLRSECELGSANSLPVHDAEWYTNSVP